MNPEYVGYVLASTPAGGVKVAVIVRVWPAARVKVLGLRTTVAAAVVRGTGPSDGKMVPCKHASETSKRIEFLWPTGWTVIAVPAGTWLRVYRFEVLPVLRTVKRWLWNDDC